MRSSLSDWAECSSSLCRSLISAVRFASSMSKRDHDALLVVIVLLREQSERFLGGKLCNASEVLYSKAIQNLSALQFPLRRNTAGTRWCHLFRRFASCLGIRVLRILRLVLGRTLW